MARDLKVARMTRTINEMLSAAAYQLLKKWLV